MFFTRTQKFSCCLPKDDFKSRLIGNHVTIHNMDFEVYEKDQSLRIVPHAEQTNAIKTLPITKVDLQEEGGQVKVTVTSHMRKLDSGGPQLVIIFCAFLFLAAAVMVYAGAERSIIYTLLAAGGGILTLFWIRLQMGYFDYVRKISAFVKGKMELAV